LPINIDKILSALDDLVNKMIGAHSMTALRSRQRRHRTARLDQTARRAMLLQHAIRAFARRGIGAAGHADVARRARVAAPTVFFFSRRERHWLAQS
jgi:hypothetical protein